MKKNLVLLLAFTATLMMASCAKEKANYNYYVRYEVSAIGSSFGIPTMYLNVNTENGMQSYSTSSSIYSETFGPVSKGFEASVSASTNYGASLYSSIYVSKGQEPFVLKATGSSSAQYVIDF